VKTKLGECGVKREYSGRQTLRAGLKKAAKADEQGTNLRPRGKDRDKNNKLKKNRKIFLQPMVQNTKTDLVKKERKRRGLRKGSENHTSAKTTKGIL